MHEKRGNFCIFLLKIAEKEGKPTLEPAGEALRGVEVGLAEHADVVALRAPQVDGEGVVGVQRAIDVAGGRALELDRRDGQRRLDVVEVPAPVNNEP